MAANEHLVVLSLDANNSVSVHLHGATIVSWKCDGEEVLFVSKRAVYDNKKAIRGGIPLVFPCFGAWSLGPQHGFARISRWNNSSPPVKKGDSVKAAFTLVDNDSTRTMWNHKFELTYSLTLRAKSLDISLSISNKGDTEFDFTCLLHTYFRVPDVTKAGVTGLKGYSYYDQVKKIEVGNETEDPLFVTDNYDRIYKNTGTVHTVLNFAGSQLMTITKNNLPDTVLWNPWAEKAKAMSDMGEDQFPNMLCVEAGKVAEKHKLAPGGTFVCGQELKLSKGITGSL